MKEMFEEMMESHNIDETAQELFKHKPTTAFDINVCAGRAQKDIQGMYAKRGFERLYQGKDTYLCHDCNSMITGEDKHQCQERITCPDCYDIFHTPEDYADHTCTNVRCSQLDDEPPTKKAKDIITCSGCNKVFNTLDDYADHPCTSRSTPLTGTEPLTAVPLTGRTRKRKGEPSAQAHIKLCAKRSENQVGRGRRTALQNHAMIETFTPTHTHDILASLKELEPAIIDHLKQQLETPIKWYMIMLCIFKKIMIDVDGNTSENKNDIYQASKTNTCMQPYEIDESIPEVFQTISGKFQEFQHERSRWILDHVVHIEVHTAI